MRVRLLPSVTAPLEPRRLDAASRAIKSGVKPQHSQGVRLIHFVACDVHALERSLIAPA